MEIKTHHGKPLEIDQEIHPDTKQILQETIPIITNQEDLDKLLFVANQLLSQKQKTKNDDEEFNEKLSEFVGKNFKKGYRIGKIVKEEYFSELREIMKDNVEYTEETKQGYLDRFSDIELGRLSIECGLIYGVFKQSYQENIKEKEKERDISQAAYR